MTNQEKRQLLIDYYKKALLLAMTDLQNESAILAELTTEKRRAYSVHGYNIKYFRHKGKEITLDIVLHNVNVAAEVLEKAQKNLEHIRFCSDDEVEKTFKLYELVGIFA